MAKGNKKFSKQSIQVRTTALPSGEAPITANIESSVAALLESLGTGMSSFYLGNGLFGKNSNSFIAKARSNKKSILGDKDSIYNLLEEIKTQLLSKSFKEAIGKNLVVQSSALQNGLFLGNVPYLSLLYDYFTKANSVQSSGNTDEIYESLMDLIKDHDEVISDISKLLKEDIVKAIEGYKDSVNYYQRSTDELLKINKDLFDNKIQSIQEAKIKILLESSGVSTIEELVKFANENTDQFVTNIDNVERFFTSLKGLENLQINETLGSIANIGVLFDSIGELLKFTEKNIELFDNSNLETIEKIFGKGRQEGILKTILNGINELPDLKKDKQKSIIDSIIGINKIFGATFLMFSFIWPLIVAFEKPMKYIIVGIDQVFNKLKDVFKHVNQFKDNPIDEQNVENIISGIKNVQKVLGGAYKLAIESWIISKAIGKGNYIDRVNNMVEDIALLMMEISDHFDSVKIENADKNIQAFLTIVDAIHAMSKKKNLKNFQKNIDQYFNAIQYFYKKIEENYEQIIKTSERVEALKAANAKIRDGVDDCTETAVKTSKETEDIKQGLMTLEGLTEFMISAAVVMTIGALFMMLGGGKFAAAALEFGITLMTFEMLVVTPLLVFRGHEKMAAQSLHDLNSFIITCTITMSIGALFMALSGGKFVKNALAFGIILSIFELLVVAPFLAFVKHKVNVFQGLSEFSGFLITTTIIMGIGALFMSLGGGKFVKNALAFGLVLGVFELLVVSPFILFGLIKNSAFENAKDFIAIVITCTTIMLVGALFITLGGGKFVKNALKFTTILMLFEMMTIAPFLLMNVMKSQVFNGMKLFNSIIITSTIILLVGALFMTLNGGKNWKAALKFTGLLMLFEIGVITPFLIFNKISNSITRGLISFGAVILAATTILMVGAMFMTMKNGEMWKAALEFTGVLSGFILAIGVISIGLTKWLGEKELLKMEEFGTFVLLSTLALTIGALVIDKYGWSAPLYAILLTAFVGAMGAIAVGLSKWLDANTLIKMEEFGVFVMLSSLALVTGALFISQYGANPVIEFGLCLLGFVGLTTLVVALISKFINPETIVDMTMFSTFLLLASGSMVIGALFVAKYGVEPVFKFMGMLLLYITEATLIMLALNFVAPYIALGIIAATGIGIALSTLAISIMLVNTLFLLDPGGKKTQSNIATLNGILSFDLILTFTALGVLAPFIVLGSVAAVALGVSMLILGGSLTLVNLLIGNHGDEIIASIVTLDTILESIKWTYFKMGLLSPFIAAGSLAAVAIGVSMTLLSTSLWVMHKMLNDLGYDRLIEELEIIGTAVVALGVLASSMILLVIPLTLAMPALVMLNVFSAGLTSSILMVDHAIKEISKEGDLTDSIQNAIKNLKAFIDIPNQIFDGSWVKSLMQMNNIQKIKAMTIPMAQVMLITARAIQGMANLQVATDWDKDGNPIKYRQLGDNDFQLAIKNTGDLLKTMASAFYYTWNGGTTTLNDGTTIDLGLGLKELYKENEDAINNIVNFGIGAGQVIHGLAEGIGNMAKMQIPIAWDKNGKPIGYRQLKQKDFALAAEGTRLILTSMAESIVQVYDSGNDPKWKKYSTQKNIFDFDEFDESPFSHTLEASLKMANLIGNVGTAVGNIAKLQIPNEWDSKGHVIGYKTLKRQDFVEMGESVKSILGAIITCIAELYIEGAPNGSLNKGVYNGNIFDINYGGLFESDKPSKFEQILGATFKISELIAKIGSGVKDIAKLQIPNYDHKGNIIGYTRLGPEDFTKMGQSVSNILTAIVDAVGGLDLKQAENTGEVFNAVYSVGGFVSDIADGIIKIASGQIPVYDKDGKTIKEYIQMTPDHYKQAGESVGKVINGIAGELINIAKNDGEPINAIFLDGTFKELVESISSMTGLISGITDSIIKLGTAQIPIDWDKDGKPTKYEHINIGEAKENLKNVVGEIISAMSTAIITVYNQKKDEGLFSENPGSGNTPFDIAVRGITGVTKIVSGITDSVIKISQALIPDKWDERGNPTHYEKIQVGTAIANIKKMFNGDEKTEGILDILMNVFTRTYDKWFRNNKALDDNIEVWQNGISGIMKIISSSSELVVNLAALSVPMGFDKDGKGKNYKKLEPSHITDVKTNVETILNALLSLPSTVNTPENDINSWVDITSSNIQKISSVIELAANVAEEFTRYKDISSKLFNTKNTGKLNTALSEELRTNIDLIKGIYDIELNANEFSKTSIERIADDLYHFVTFGINCFDEEALKRFGKLNSAIKTIYDNIGSQKDNSQNFKNNRIQLENYVKAINTVDVKKVDSLTSLVKELNSLSVKMGNLDNLTTAIAEKLSGVLAELVEKLEESKTTIETAERIQTARHKLIDKSIDKVKEIMENPISVLVSSDTTQAGDDGQPASEEDKKKAPGYQGGGGRKDVDGNPQNQGGGGQGNGTPKNTARKKGGGSAIKSNETTGS